MPEVSRATSKAIAAIQAKSPGLQQYCAREGNGAPTSDLVTITAHLPQNEGIIKQSSITLRSTEPLPNLKSGGSFEIRNAHITVESVELILKSGLKFTAYPRIEQLHIGPENPPPEGFQGRVYPTASFRLPIASEDDRQALFAVFPQLREHITETRERLFQIQDPERSQKITIDNGKSETRSKKSGFIESAIPLSDGRILSRNSSGVLLVFEPFVSEAWLQGKFDKTA